MVKNDLKKDKSLEKIAEEAKARGNDIEVRSSKNGLKVYEVSKKLIKEIILPQ